MIVSFPRKHRLKARLKFLAAATFFAVVLFRLQKAARPPADDPCRGLEALQDVAIGVRTGATEIHKKLPAQLETVLQCAPVFSIFSDLHERTLGHDVHDIVAEVSTTFRESHPDFRLYHALREKGPDHLTHDDLWLKDADGGINGHPTNKAWVMDKWKFLPLVAALYKKHPHAKWYVVMEPDTYIIWRNVLRMMEKYEYSEPHYIGSIMSIGTQSFAHGGGGILISAGAMKKCADYYNSHQKEVEEFTATQWAGDYVLGKIMTDAGVDVKGSWPLQQIHHVMGTDFARSKPQRIWCNPAVSYHHMTPQDLRDFWIFEKNWTSRHGSKILRHSDVFKHYVLPQLTSGIEQWDNFDGEEMDHKTRKNMTRAGCHAECEEQSDCQQYSIDEDGVCRTCTAIHFGRAVPRKEKEIYSGWMMNRIIESFENIQECTEADTEWF